MTRINAEEIWRLILEYSWNKEAYEFYTRKRISKIRLLDQGAANLDEKIGLVGEKSWYRAAFYTGPKGYMDMHLRQNKAVFLENEFTEILKNRRVLFVDFGCGPMTSGVVLADNLSSNTKYYKDKIVYVGIDRSENMCKIAKWVNEVELNYRIIDRFHVLNEDTIVPQKVCNIAKQHFHPEVAVLCLSYVMAPNTYAKNQAAAADLARKWQEIIQMLPSCQETILIYMNPKHSAFHSNWDCMIREFSDQPSRNWHFKISPRKSIAVNGVPGRGKVVTQIITGKRRNCDVII